MNDAEKIKRHDAIEEVKNCIRGCFGSADGVFAAHPSDTDRAQNLKRIILENNLPLTEIRDIALCYLYHKGYVKDHIDEQIQKVYDFLK